MKIVIGGDVSIKFFHEVFAAKETDKAFDKGLQALFHSADETIVNLECAVTDNDTPIQKVGPNLRAPIGTGDVLKEAGVTICALSNNHIFDHGRAGAKDTLDELNRCGLRYTGYGKDVLDARKDLIIEKEGKKIAIINVCEHEYTYALPDREGAREYDPYDTTDDIIAAKKNADYVVVIYHGGKEQCKYPSPRLLKLCRSMVHHGADVVLCQHSHCIGCYEEYKGAHILYGQGNFHFSYLDKDWDWNTGLAVILEIDDKGLRFAVEPVVLDEPCLRLANEEERAQLLGDLAARSATIQDGTWIDGWRKFCEEVSWYWDVIQTGKVEYMAHYLDCEAHSDVLKERYKTLNATNEKD